MNEPLDPSDQKIPNTSKLQFGDELFIEGAGFSFRPIIGFELEVDGSIYLYSEDGNLKICIIGGELASQASLVELNDELAADFMINFDEVNLVESGKDLLQGITGWVKEIHFINAEEEGLGRTLICSPHLTQFFFLLVIATAEHWREQGMEVFTAIKDHIHFHPKSAPETKQKAFEKHPDLIVDTFESIYLHESLLVSTLRDDISLLLAARATSIQDEITLLKIMTPNNDILYRYDPESSTLTSQTFTQPLCSNHGELCLLLPFPG
jgi:hypothetical protein